MKALKLNFSDLNVEFFSQLFLAEDHNSADHTFMGLYKVLTMWSSGVYHVYCPVDDNDMPMGICHGQAIDNTFFGHIYFLKEYRGKKACQGFDYCVSMLEHNLGVNKLVTHILEENRPAKMFASLMGFKKVDNTKYICDLQESA